MNSLLTTWEGRVLPEWVDYNGHLRDAFYLLIFSVAVDSLMDRIGLDEAGRAATGHTIYTLETHLNYLQEVKVDVAVAVQTQILGMDAKRLHIFNSLQRLDDGTLLATNEMMLSNIDTTGPRSAPFHASVAARLTPLAESHRHLPRPAQAGRSIHLPTPRVA